MQEKEYNAINVAEHTHLSQTLRISKDKEKYDTYVKELLADKQVLARVLKYSLDEFMECAIDEIISEIFIGSNYDDIKHVRSIWICMDSSEEEDSINQIYLGQKALYGKNIKLNNLDKVVGVIIRIRKNENAEESKNILIAMLEELVRKKELREKKKNLVEKYGLVMTDETERRVGTMCNWSDVVFDDAMIKGLQDGMEKGMQ